MKKYNKTRKELMRENDKLRILLNQYRMLTNSTYGLGSPSYDYTRFEMQKLASVKNINYARENLEDEEIKSLEKSVEKELLNQVKDYISSSRIETMDGKLTIEKFIYVGKRKEE